MKQKAFLIIFSAALLFATVNSALAAVKKTYANGALVGDKRGAVYLIENGKKRGFTSAEAFLERGYSFKKVVRDSGNILSTIPDGALIEKSRPHDPNTPTITGPTEVVVNSNSEFSFSASDPDNDELAHTVNWGDGVSEAAVRKVSGAQYFLTHKYTTAGSYVITVSVIDDYRHSASASFAVTVKTSQAVTPPPPPAQPQGSSLSFSYASLPSPQTWIGLGSQPVGAFKATVTSESVTVSRMVFNILSGNPNGRLTKILVKDSAGQTVAGPLETAGSTVTTTAPILFPVGVNQYTLWGNPETGFAEGNLLHLDVVSPASVVVAKGAQSGNAVTASPAAGIALDTVTLRPVKVVLSAWGPDAQNVKIGTKGFKFLSLKIDAGNAAEDIKISQVSLVHATSGPNFQHNISNLTVWADGNIQPPGISPAPAATNSVVEVIKFITPITVYKGQSKTLDIVGDVAGLPGQTHSYSCPTETCVSLTGVSTGYGVTPGFVPGGGAAMTVSAN